MPVRRLTVRIRDEELIRALERAREQGIVVNRLVSDALRRVLLEGQSPRPAASADAGRGFDSAFWDRMRSVVEAAVTAALAAQGIDTATSASSSDADAERAEAFLDALGAGLDEFVEEE